MPDKRQWAGAIRSTADVRAVLDDVNRHGLTRANTTALAVAVRPGTDTELEPDASKLLPVDPRLTPLLPWPGGLRRGATVAAVGSTSLLMLLVAAAMREGSWAAVVGMPQFGVLAAAEYGIPLDRLALIDNPGPEWPTVVAALIDGVDLVVVQAPPGVSEATVRSLQARARQRGAVLIPTAAWPSSDLVLQAGARQWTGLGQGRGRLRTQQLELRASGRGRAARPKTTSIIPTSVGTWSATS